METFKFMQEKIKDFQSETAFLDNFVNTIDRVYNADSV